MVEVLEMGYFVWAIIVTVISVALVAIVIYMQKNHRESILTLEDKLSKKQTQSYQAGSNFQAGELTEILASFKLLTEYDQLAYFSSVSKAFSIDLMGIKLDDSVDFIEVKTDGADLKQKENKVKKLIDEKKVRYRIIDGKFPEFNIKDRESKRNNKKKTRQEEQTI